MEGGLKAFAEEALERSLPARPSGQAAFKALFTRLYRRQVDGTLTTWLAPRNSLESSWCSSSAFRPGGGGGRVSAMPARECLRIEGADLALISGWGTMPWPGSLRPGRGNGTRRNFFKKRRAKLELERKKPRQIRKLVVGFAWRWVSPLSSGRRGSGPCT